MYNKDGDADTTEAAQSTRLNRPACVQVRGSTIKEIL
jgi:hypothetical protein